MRKFCEKHFPPEVIKAKLGHFSPKPHAEKASSGVCRRCSRAASDFAE